MQEIVVLSCYIALSVACSNYVAVFVLLSPVIP